VRAKKDDGEEDEELKKDWKFGRNEGGWLRLESARMGHRRACSSWGEEGLGAQRRGASVHEVQLPQQKGCRHKQASPHAPNNAHTTGPMGWGWKLCCAILYMLPWVDVTEKTVYFIERFPAFHWTEYFTGAHSLRVKLALCYLLHWKSHAQLARSSRSSSATACASARSPTLT